MITNEFPVMVSVSEEMLRETGVWMNMMNGWKREVGKVVEMSGTVRASCSVTAEVARTAGELSLFAQKLDELYEQIATHRLNLSVAEAPDSECTQTHHVLSVRLQNECEIFRSLLSELLKLNNTTSKPFLC